MIVWTGRETEEGGRPKHKKGGYFGLNCGEPAQATEGSLLSGESDRREEDGGGGTGKQRKSLGGVGRND